MATTAYDVDTQAQINPLGDGAWMAAFRGFTGADGSLSFVFDRPFNVIVGVNVERLPPTLASIVTRITALSLAGITVVAEARSSLTVLTLQVLSFATVPAAGQEVSITVMGR